LGGKGGKEGGKENGRKKEGENYGKRRLISQTKRNTYIWGSMG